MLRAGIGMGLTVIDTAELYADGEAESIVGDAIRGREDEVFVVSKVLPSNATSRGVVTACERSLRRLRSDCIDLYLLHWRRDVLLSEAVKGFQNLLDAGKIRAWGVSNFNVADLDDLPPGSAPRADQVLYNLVRRGPEADLIPRCVADGIGFMAYSPIEKGQILDHLELVRLASERGVTPAQVALAWTVRGGDIVAIPKASSHRHVRENAGALDLHLTDEELRVLDRAFPAPGIVPLETLS